MSRHAKTDTPIQKGLKGLGCLILVSVFLLYPMSYVVGRVTGVGGMVLDATRGGIFLRHVNALYAPLRKLDYKFTEEEFYWFFFDD